MNIDAFTYRSSGHNTTYSSCRTLYMCIGLMNTNELPLLVMLIMGGRDMQFAFEKSK